MDQSIMAWIGMQGDDQNQSQIQAQQHQSLASQFHFLHLIEGLADAVEGGVRDQHSDMLVNELTARFEKCQQLLNSMAGSMDAKAMTIRRQKQKLEEYERQLNLCRDLISKYKSTVEKYVGSPS